MKPESLKVKMVYKVKITYKVINLERAPGSSAKQRKNLKNKLV